MELTMAGVDFTGIFGAVVFVVFALFSFLAVFSGGKFSLEKIGRAFAASLRFKSVLIAFLCFIAGMAFMLAMSLIGSALSGALRSAVPGVVFSIIGAAGLFYVLLASAYITNFMAFAALRDERRAAFGEALKSWFSQQWQVLLLPAILCGIILVEMGILLLIGQLNDRSGIFLLSAIFYLPFLPLNLVLFTLLFLGCGIFIPIMIDQKKNALVAFKAVALAIKQQVLRLLATQVIVITFLGIVMVVMYLLFQAATTVGAAGAGQSPLVMLVQEFFKNPIGIFAEIFTAAPLIAIGGFLLLLLIVFVLAVAAGYIWNLNMCLYVALYLGFIRENVDFNAKLFEGKK